MASGADSWHLVEASIGEGRWCLKSTFGDDDVGGGAGGGGGGGDELTSQPPCQQLPLHKLFSLEPPCQRCACKSSENVACACLQTFWTSLNVVSLCSAPGDGSQLQVEKTRVRLTCSWLVDHLKSGAAIVSQTQFLKLFWVAIEVGSNYLSLILFSNRVQIANYSSGTTQFGELLLKLNLQEEELPSVPACLQSCPADQPE